jgi:hypothetical protein
MSNPYEGDSTTSVPGIKGTNTTTGEESDKRRWGVAWPMGIDCGLDLWRGSDVTGSDERVRCLVGSRCVQ